MTPDELQKRTKAFSLRVIKLVAALPADMVAREIGRQLVRSGMSVSANYRAARRARSKREFVAKIGIVAEESDETAHWIDLLKDSGLVSGHRLEPLHREADELMRIFSSTQRTARSRMNSIGNRKKSTRPERVGVANSIAKSPDRQIAKYNVTAE